MLMNDRSSDSNLEKSVCGSGVELKKLDSIHIKLIDNPYI
jgi:hypothetical protein